jgi:hypothetical protein
MFESKMIGYRIHHRKYPYVTLSSEDFVGKDLDKLKSRYAELKDNQTEILEMEDVFEQLVFKNDNWRKNAN